MPTVTKAQIDRDAREHKATAKIMQVIRDAELTPVQAMSVLSAMLHDYTRRLAKHEEQDLADARACLRNGETSPEDWTLQALAGKEAE